MHRKREILNFTSPLLDKSLLADYAGQLREDKWNSLILQSFLNI
jgi:hypothetical protein